MEANQIEYPCEVHELPLDPSTPKLLLPLWHQFAKKINPSAVEEVVVGRTAGAGRTLEAALEPEKLNRSDPRTQ